VKPAPLDPLPTTPPLRSKYGWRTAGKNMRSNPNGNNAKKSPNHVGLRWHTARAAARRGNSCNGCVGSVSKS
jgi:hypothetical protein